MPNLPFFLDTKTQKHFTQVCLHCKSAGAHCSLLLLFFVAKMTSHIMQCRLLCESAQVYCFVLLMLRKRSFRFCCGRLHQERLCARCPNRADGLLWPHQRRWFVISRRAVVTHIPCTSTWALQHKSTHMHKYSVTLYASLACNLQPQAGNQPDMEKCLRSLTLLTYEGVVRVLDTFHELLSDFSQIPFACFWGGQIWQM